MDSSGGNNSWIFTISCSFLFKVPGNHKNRAIRVRNALLIHLLYLCFNNAGISNEKVLKEIKRNFTYEVFIIRELTNLPIPLPLNLQFPSSTSRFPLLI
jgi:hypothetical protein